MTTYISILRGINVSGHKIIKMEDLRKLYSDLGFHNVRSYIQSGNVVFETKKAKTSLLEKKITEKISEKYGFDVPIMVMEYEELKDIINVNPFLKDKTKDPAHFHITFLSAKPDPKNFNKIKNEQFDEDEFQLIDKAIYLYLPNRYSNSKLSNAFLESKLKVTATTRNWKTSNELLKLSEIKNQK